MKILVLPHIGTAYGHFFRTVEIVANRFLSPNNKITFVLSKNTIIHRSRHLPPGVDIYERQFTSSICSKSGLLDIEGYKHILQENLNIVTSLKPDLIIGDPGIQASILSTSFNIPWIGIMHGCYLPLIPMTTTHHMGQEHMGLMKRVWDVINCYLDYLISIGTNGKYTNWATIRKTGEILIPGDLSNFYSNIGTSLGPTIPCLGWQKGNPVDYLMTCCSAGTVIPSADFIRRLSNLIPHISIAGIKKNAMPSSNNVRILGNGYSYSSLVSSTTTVVTHCGNGTLGAITDAKRVIMIPADLDQLCNALIYNAAYGWELVLDRNWFHMLNAVNPFRREMHWDNLSVKHNGTKVIIQGVEMDDMTASSSNNVA